MAEFQDAKQMNGDLISREEAIELIRSLSISIGGKEIFHPEAKKSVIEALDLSPTVDAAPVVHCCECKCYETDAGFCRYWESGTLCDDFCSRGAKMDQEEQDD